jgi:hypothetical protein
MFQVSVHNQECTRNPEKLLYLRQAAGGGPAAQVIDGLVMNMKKLFPALRQYTINPERYMKHMSRCWWNIPR